MSLEMSLEMSFLQNDEWLIFFIKQNHQQKQKQSPTTSSPQTSMAYSQSTTTTSSPAVAVDILFDRVFVSGKLPSDVLDVNDGVHSRIAKMATISKTVDGVGVPFEFATGDTSELQTAVAALADPHLRTTFSTHYDEWVNTGFSPYSGRATYAAGAPSDDSEMGTLAAASFKTVFDEKGVSSKSAFLDGYFSVAMKNYMWWRSSNPYDIGQLTANKIDTYATAMKGAVCADGTIDGEKLNDIYASLMTTTSGYPSDGHLMRLAPLVAAASKFIPDLTLDTLMRIIIADACITHSEPLSLGLACAYGAAVAVQLRTGSVEKAKACMGVVIDAIRPDLTTTCLFGRLAVREAQPAGSTVYVVDVLNAIRYDSERSMEQSNVLPGLEAPYNFEGATPTTGFHDLKEPLQLYLNGDVHCPIASMGCCSGIHSVLQAWRALTMVQLNPTTTKMSDIFQRQYLNGGDADTHPVVIAGLIAGAFPANAAPDPVLDEWMHVVAHCRDTDAASTLFSADDPRRVPTGILHPSNMMSVLGE
jgi:ADP-ribosylglycohydrolase